MTPGTTEDVIRVQPPSVSLEINGRRAFCIALGCLTLCFAKPLYDLFRFSLRFDLYSHILLIPFISGYLIWTKRAELPQPKFGSVKRALLPAIAGVLILGSYAFILSIRENLPQADRLTFSILSFYLFTVSVTILCLGSRLAHAIAFPLGFLAFIVPFPEWAANGLEIASEHASAEVLSWMLSLSRAVYFRDGVVFSFPGLTIQVAQECSGIRSSFVLFITSLLAGHMFFRTGWRKALLAFAVLPLGLLRNAFRIYVLCMLTVHWNPHVIDSPLHHKGGPLFFVISLFPFFLLLVWLRRSEAKGSRHLAQPAK